MRAAAVPTESESCKVEESIVEESTDSTNTPEIEEVMRRENSWVIVDEMGRKF